jgi:hypothetical protein
VLPFALIDEGEMQPDNFAVWVRFVVVLANMLFCESKKMPNHGRLMKNLIWQTRAEEIVIYSAAD